MLESFSMLEGEEGLWTLTTEPPPVGSRWVQQSGESPTALGGLGECFCMPQPSRRSPGMPALGLDQAIIPDWKWSPEGEGF
jgi:hypothetical protein